MTRQGSRVSCCAVRVVPKHRANERADWHYAKGSNKRGSSRLALLPGGFGRVSLDGHRAVRRELPGKEVLLWQRTCDAHSTCIFTALGAFANGF